MVFAALYDIVFRRAEHKGLRAMRKDLLSQCTGNVLEIGAGLIGLTPLVRPVIRGQARTA
jgi:hypothetical protein